MINTTHASHRVEEANFSSFDGGSDMGESGAEGNFTLCIESDGVTLSG